MRAHLEHAPRLSILFMILVLRETHEAPGGVARALESAGGRNWFGEPNYRAVWGWSRLDWIGGKWEDRDAGSGALLREVVQMRREPKYLPHDRWHIERWMPAESYGSPEEWAAQTGEFVGGRSVRRWGRILRGGITSIASRCRGRAGSSCS